ncbi:MAG: tetraacyldisaccharide 4'-kinase [Bacteroidales bacterium]|nr:tetraacyldisaccharide 4'-kinase [Bacteroidales bacterium]
MKFLKVILLYPLSLIYGFAVNIRNTLFDFNILKSQEFEIPVISVGNITVGGTGKTPTTEYIIRILQEKYNVAVLSRGYKRKTKGFFLATSKSTVEEIGDEPYQIKQKFPKTVIAVDEKRVRGISNIQQLNPDIDVIILDDAFQHRYVKPGLSILLIDYTQPFFEDFFLPYGRLRDSSKEKHRADIVLVTKAPPDIKPIDMRIMATNLELRAYQSLYFSTLKYSELLPVFNNSVSEINTDIIKEKKYSAVLVSGIGNFKPLLEYCNKTADSLVHIPFKDHHKYTEKDLVLIAEKYRSLKTENKIILTTEKDAGKIKNISIGDKEIKENLFCCPIEVEILNGEKEDFDSQIMGYINKDKSQYRFMLSKKKF